VISCSSIIVSLFISSVFIKVQTHWAILLQQLLKEKTF